ncbi:peptide-methionine (S)-S-oxide reductase [Desulfomicrobium macestii]|uniref:Peptide methionine sulfoxide reductase MsrA n=1 Tax=Desulfomicrobium macestii TaxID=90731 RepID=A0ABR9H1K3_9BACT|nr:MULTISPECIES: peptide-methionine (S)-S-oxide reductase MsrA [Desulfomicrobium]MBE1424585.1 peptide-methionine (S)-S-oxide reductase [Desulfomicrobium macestii]
MAAQTKEAVFAGGCFWCLEGPFDALPGVLETEAGYTGGQIPNPTYEQVSSGTSGHIEAMRVKYDPELVDFGKLLDVFWRNIDPTDAGGQFCDRGPQYRSAVFFADEAEESAARASKAQLEEARGFKIATEILPRAEFYAAEEYHQDYYKKNPLRYHFYRQGCGRDQRLRQLWGAEAKK